MFHNFLILTHFVLSEVTTPIAEWVFLRSLVDEKLRESKQKTLTSFRQNNEVSQQSLKKIAKHIIDSHAPECSPFKFLAFEVQDMIKNQLNTAIANLNSQNYELITNLPTAQIEFL